MDEKLNFFRETRHAFGRTALLLSGGGGLGSFHLVRHGGGRETEECVLCVFVYAYACWCRMALRDLLKWVR